MENKAIKKTRSSWPSLFDNAWMERIFNAPLDEFFNLGKVMNVPAANVSETDKEFLINMAAPGLEKKDFKIETIDDLLTISAEHEKEEKESNDRFNRREYNYSSWSRSFILPENCNHNKIDAAYKNGELKIMIPKKEIKEPKKANSISVS